MGSKQALDRRLVGIGGVLYVYTARVGEAEGGGGGGEGGGGAYIGSGGIHVTGETKAHTLQPSCSHTHLSNTSSGHKSLSAVFQPFHLVA